MERTTEKLAFGNSGYNRELGWVMRLNMGQETVEVYRIHVKSTFTWEWMP